MKSFCTCIYFDCQLNFVSEIVNFFFYRAVLKRKKKKLNTSYSGELSHSKVFNCLSLFLYNLYVVQKSRDFYLFRNIFALFDNIKSLMGKLAICYLVAKYRKYLQMP